MEKNGPPWGPLLKALSNPTRGSKRCFARGPLMTPMTTIPMTPYESYNDLYIYIYTHHYFVHNIVMVVYKRITNKSKQVPQG